MSEVLPALLAAGPGGFAVGALAAVLLARSPALGRVLPHGIALVAGAATVAAGVVGILAPSWRIDWPWLLPPPGAQLRLDPLGGYFLILIGAASLPASLYAIGYLAERRQGLARVTVAYNVFLGAMTLVPLAANVLTFLVAWELMSLASYVLVVLGRMGLCAGDARGPRLPARRDAAPGERDRDGIPRRLGRPRRHDAGRRAHARLPVARPRLRLQGGAGAGPRVAAARPPGRAEPRLRADVRRDDQARRLWPSPCRARVAERRPALVGRDAPPGRRRLRRAGGAVCPRRARPQAPAGVSQRRERRHHRARARGRHGLPRHGPPRARPARPRRGPLPHREPRGVQGAPLSRRRRGASRHRHPQHGADGRAAQADAVDGRLLPRRRRRHLRVAPAQRLRQRVADLPGPAAELRGARRGPEPRLRRRPGGARAHRRAGRRACFVKAFGICFLALPRSDAAAGAHEAPGTLRAGMVALAASCVALGLGATLVLPGLARVAATLDPGGRRAPIVVGDALTVVVTGGFGTLSPLVVAPLLLLALPGLALGLRLRGVRADTRRYETWSCGRLLQTARMEYTATAFSQPFKRIFAILYRPEKQLEIEFHPESRYFVRTIRYENPTRSVIEDWLYLPALTGARRLAAAARRVQSGSANLYLGYIFAALLALLLLAVR